MKTYSESQKNFMHHVLNGDNIFLNGKAGTGKSFITKEAIKSIEKLGKKVIVVAPTGIAANNIGGATIHSTFSLPVHGVIKYANTSFLKSSKRDVLKKIDVLIIDEVSMVRADVLDGINWTMIKNGCKNLTELQVIFVGDMKQLEPPVDDNMKSVMLKDYDDITIDAAQIFKRLNMVDVELKEVLRQSDKEFIDSLNIVREGQKSDYFRQFVSEYHSGIVLAPHNATVAKYNHEGINSINSKSYFYKAVLKGNVKITDFNFEPELELKEGAKIMYLVNSKNNNLVNGTLGIFRKEGDKLFIEVNQVKYAIDFFEQEKKEYVLNEKENKLELISVGSITQLPVKLAYALSIHKSQGLTFDEVTVDLTKPCFARGQMYVALSRVKTPQGLKILTDTKK